ncbi:MAG: response regulator transcription factor [Candidatus Cloacimonadota bacterium]|nr:MAG: response regulator transcription factor [Candidatus Cloacimonadota bacterium]
MIIRVILADDHPVVRDGIKSIVDRRGTNIEIIGEVSNGKELLEMAKENPADVYVIDITMPILNGLETTKRLIKMEPRSKVIILSIHDSRIFVEKALESGAKGYVLKEDTTEDVIHAIQEVYSGRFFLSPGVSKFVVHGFLGKIHGYKRYKKIVNITKREREILQLIAEGFTNKEIASKLKRSLNTVHVHRNNIMQKLDIHKQADLIRFAIKEGISKL